MATSSEVAFLDTNVLVYATDESADHHAACRDLCARGASGSEHLCLSPQILSEFMSVVTNPNILPRPLSARDARIHAEMLAASFTIITAGEGVNHTDGGAANSATSSLVTLTVNNLPWAGPVNVRHYLLDNVHSNAYDDWVAMGRPSAPTQAQWVTIRDAAELCYYESAVTPSANSWTVSFPAKNYSVHLLVLSP
jgi:predicted nucleic acid-binding protein